MDRDYYRSLTEAYNSIYEAPGFGALAGPGGQILRQGGKVGGSLALQKATNWPDYVKYRDQGMSKEEAIQKIAANLGLNVTGSVAGGTVGTVLGPKGTVAGSVAGGPALVALADALDDSYTQKQLNQRQGIVWDDKSSSYVVKPENLTRYRGESDEEFETRVAEGKKRVAELNKGGAKAPDWLEWERKREKERASETAQQAQVDAANRNKYDRGEGAGPLGKSKGAEKPGNYTVAGIEYDGTTGRPVNPPPAFVPGQSRNPPAAETETETETDTREISGYDKDGKPIYTQDVEQRNVESGATPAREVSGYDKDGNPIYTSDVEQRNVESGATPAPTGGNVGSETQTPKGPTNKDGSSVTQTGKNDKGLTPYQQWAKNFPKLAAKVKPGQAGYDDIQAMKKATPAAVTDPQPNADGKTGQTGGGVVDGARRAASRAADAARTGAARVRNSNAGQRVGQATDNAIRATRRAAQKAAGSQAVRTVKDQAGKGLSRLNNAVRNRTGNNNNE